MELIELIKEINSLLKVERRETNKHNIGLKVYLKISHDKEFIEFYLTEFEINQMYEILHKRD